VHSKTYINKTILSGKDETMPFLPRLSFAEQKKISVINKAPESATVDNLRAVCLGVSTFKYPMHVDGLQNNEIIPGLFLGEGPLNPLRLEKLGVVRVLEVGGLRNVLVTDKCRNPYKDEGLKFMAVNVEDSENAKIMCYFEECAKFIERGLKNGGVYVYSPGVSRGATIVAAFLMLRKGMSGVAAVRSIHIRKPVSPNLGFLRQLAKLEANIKDLECKLCSHLEVVDTTVDEFIKKRPLYAPIVYYRDPKNYDIASMGFNRQKVAQHMYFQCEDAAVNPITHTEKGAVKRIVFKAL